MKVYYLLNHICGISAFILILNIGMVSTAQETNQFGTTQVSSKQHSQQIEQDDTCVTLILPAEVMVAGDKINGILKVKNKYHQTIFLYSNPPVKYKRLECLRGGEPVPMTAYGRYIYDLDLLPNDPRFGRESISASGIDVGEDREFDLRLSRMFDLSVPGEYEIKLSLRFKIKDDPPRAGGPDQISIKFKLVERTSEKK